MACMSKCFTGRCRRLSACKWGLYWYIWGRKYIVGGWKMRKKEGNTFLGTKNRFGGLKHRFWRTKNTYLQSEYTYLRMEYAFEDEKKTHIRTKIDMWSTGNTYQDEKYIFEGRVNNHIPFLSRGENALEKLVLTGWMRSVKITSLCFDWLSPQIGQLSRKKRIDWRKSSTKKEKETEKSPPDNATSHR